MHYDQFNAIIELIKYFSYNDNLKNHPNVEDQHLPDDVSVRVTHDGYSILYYRDKQLLDFEYNSRYMVNTVQRSLLARYHIHLNELYQQELFAIEQSTSFSDRIHFLDDTVITCEDDFDNVHFSASLLYDEETIFSIMLAKVLKTIPGLLIGETRVFDAILNVSAKELGLVLETLKNEFGNKVLQ